MVQRVADDIICEYIQSRSNVALGDICLSFGVSESTARRALSRLAKEGRIQRYRSAAVALSAKPTAYDQRLAIYSTEKDQIAKIAADTIKNGSSVILLGGTTVNAMCPYLYGKELTVITNSLTVIDRLKGTPGIQIIMLGGVYNHEEYEFVGNVTAMGLRSIYADSLFIGCVGFSPDIGFMTNHIDTIEFYKLCIKNAKRTTMLADSTKSNSSGIAIFAYAEEIHHLITDDGTAPEVVTAFHDLGVDVSIAKNRM